MNYGVESLDKTERNADTARVSSIKALWLEHTEGNTARVCTTKRTPELELELGRINASLNLENLKKNEVGIPNSKERFVMTGTESLRQCSHIDFEVVATDRNPGFFMIVTLRKDSSLNVCRSRVVAARGPGVKRVLQLKLTRVINIK